MQRDQTRTKRWIRRALTWLVGAVALFVCVALATLLIVLHSFDRPWLKTRIQSAAREAAGVDVDYRDIEIDLSGLDIEGLVVRSPAEFRGYAPDLLRLGHAAARWSLRSLGSGRGPLLERVQLSDVVLTVVVDEHGRTSFDALLSQRPPSPPSSSVPLSQLASKYLGAQSSPPPVARLAIDRVALVLLRTERSMLLERSELRGLSLALQTHSLEPAARGWRVNAALGAPASPLDLALSRTVSGAPARVARARFWTTADATPATLRAAIDLRVLDQTFLPNVSADHGLHAEADVHFDPTGGQTEIVIRRVEAGDDAAKLEGSLEVSDAGTALIQRAHGAADLAQLLGWLPDGLVPVTADRARLQFDIDSLLLGPTLRLSRRDGVVAIEADFANLTVSALASPLSIDAAKLSVHAEQPDRDGLAARGSLSISRARMDEAVVQDLALDFAGAANAERAIDGRVGVRFAHAAVPNVIARAMQLELRSRQLQLGDDLFATRGDVSLTASVRALEAHTPTARASAEGLLLRAHAALSGHAPYAAELELSAAPLRVQGRDGVAWTNGPARIEAQARDVAPDPAQPFMTRAALHSALEIGDLKASLDATKERDALDFVLSAAHENVAALRAFLPGELTDAAAKNHTTLALHANGRVEQLASKNPSLRQTTRLDLERAAFHDSVARSVSLVLHSQGTSLRHEADLDLRAQGLAIGRDSARDEHVTLSAKIDRTRPSLQWQLASEGRANTKLAGSLSFDRSRAAIDYALNGKLANLAPLAPFLKLLRGLEAFDLSELELSLSARGALLGVVSSVTGDGRFALQPNPLQSALIDGASELRLTHFRWQHGDTALIAPDVAWRAELHGVAERRTLDSHLEIGTLHVDVGSRDVDLNGIDDQTRLTFIGNLNDPDAEIEQHLVVRSIEQTLLPEYPLGELDFALSAERNPDGVVHISGLKFANRASGSTLALSGNVDLTDGRRSLSVNASLAQDLARLSTIPERMKGRGKLSVDANVTSPDLTHYLVRAAVKGEDVHVQLARAGYALESANGEVPITVALEFAGNGVVLERSRNRNPYSMLRFADQLPLLRRSGFLSIVRLKTPFVTIAPLVGNLEVEQNFVSLRQFEMGVRGGSITGQCGLDWDGPKSTLELHVRANGVRSSHGEPFDGNIAVAISAGDRTIDGRAEVLRIGERHLLDLLDLQDPQHVDAAMNRIRGALKFGYPDSMRLVFDHGFASAHLELGGLARLVSIGELRGIPMGPIVDRMIAQMTSGPDAAETP